MTDSQPVSTVVGARVRELRQLLGWSVRRLVDELHTKTGMQVTAAQIENLEGAQRKRRNEQRRVSVDELLALAFTLGVHPVNLLVPNRLDDDAPYDVAPKVTTTAAKARHWIAGVGLIGESETVLRMAEQLGLSAAQVHRLLEQSIAEQSVTLEKGEVSGETDDQDDQGR